MTSPSKLQIAESRHGDIVVLSLTGQITLDDGDLAFGRHIDQLVAAESQRLAAQGGSMRLAHLTARSHHLLAMLKLKLMFEIYDDVDAAVRSFTWRPK
jgi:hypothetical protein